MCDNDRAYGTFRQVFECVVKSAERKVIFLNKIKKLLLIENSFKELFTVSKIKELFKHYREIILYIVFGIVTTAVNWAVYALLTKVLSVDLASFSDVGIFDVLFGKSIESKQFFADNSSQLIRLFVCNLLAWVAGVIVAFITNKIWVFESKNKNKAVIKEFLLFTGSRTVTGCLEWFGLPLLILLGMNKTLFGVEGFFAKIIISVLVVILNYVFSKLIVFKKSHNI